MSDTDSWATPASSVTGLTPSQTRTSGTPLHAQAVKDTPVALEPGVNQTYPTTAQTTCCDQCGSTGERNLVVCIDGTSNQFSTKNTNVVELYSRLVKDKSQLTFYNSGIGTYAKPSWKSWDYRKQVIANKLDLAFALRFEKIILGAYAWLVDNYEPGDRIFLFGFSRGAYQVRALAAMIDIVGLLYKGNNDQIPFAYELYAASDDPDQARNLAAQVLPQEGVSVAVANRIKTLFHSKRALASEPAKRGSNTSEPPPSMPAQFKKTFSQPNVRVHFVGAWDTVSSVGFIRDKTLPMTTNGMKCTCFFRHALALHEFRVKFLPEYVNGSHGPDPEDPQEGTEPHTKEVWFAGCHSDIGGGSTMNTTLDQFGPALRWMSHEGEVAGLRIKPGPRSWTQIEVSKSMTPIWRIVECLPIKRLAFNHEGDAPHSGKLPMLGGPPRKLATTWIPHLCAHRRIQSGQLIYGPVDSKDVPFELPKDARKEEDASMEAIIVLRPPDEVLQHGCILDDRNSALLQAMISSEKGIKSLDELNVIGYIHHMLQLCRTLEGTQDIFKDLREIYTAYVQGLGQFNTHINLSHAVTFPFDMRGHSNAVSSVGFLSDTLLLSGSWDETLRIWDVTTGEITPGSPVTHRGRGITWVAVHIAKSLVASACYDATIRLWTFESNGAVHTGKVLEDESNSAVYAVAFSPDGSHLVSGSDDGTIRMWNAAGERVGWPVQRHLDRISSVAFSSDGTYVASGSRDRAVQLWKWSPGEGALWPNGKALNIHTGVVFSVAFSPDGRVIASASKDKTVRIWDVATLTLKLTLKGHANDVNSAVFSPTGTHIVSGSDDWTVRIWDACTGATIRVLRGHTGWVRSIAISPDGMRIASCSDDGTVRVWDFAVDPDESHEDDDVQAVPAQIAAR